MAIHFTLSSFYHLFGTGRGYAVDPIHVECPSPLSVPVTFQLQPEWKQLIGLSQLTHHLSGLSYSWTGFFIYFTLKASEPAGEAQARASPPSRSRVLVSSDRYLHPSQFSFLYFERRITSFNQIKLNDFLLVRSGNENHSALSNPALPESQYVSALDSASASAD